MNNAFWKNKKVLITGHTGFKGSWLSLYLHTLGADITGLALDPPTDQYLFECVNLNSILDSHIIDIRDYISVRSLIAESQPEIIFHMAAQSLVRYSYSNPIDTYTTNVIGTVNILEAVHQVGCVRAFVNVTSDKCYQNNEWAWGYRENDPLGGVDPYSSSKGCSEMVTAALRASFFSNGGCHIATGRAGNVIGGGDWSIDRLVPDLMRCFTAKETVLIRNPNAIRPWQHVLDALSGYLCLAQRLYSQDGARFSVAWNFGPDHTSELEVSKIVHKLAKLWGEDASYELVNTSKGPHEATYLKLDSTKARTQLGWKPYWGLDEVLNATVEWYQAYANQSTDLTKIMNEQIQQYQNASN